MARNFFNNIFSSQKLKEQPVLVELHNHFLPGIDDGCKTVEESLEVIRTFADRGYQKIIMTPHIMQGAYNNNAQTIGNALMQLNVALQSAGINIKTEAAAEYFFDDYFIGLLKEGAELLAFSKQKYLLFEIPTSNKPHQLEETIFEMKLQGYKPVLAHPERYPLYHEKSLKKYDALKDLDVYFQVNLMSFTGHYGKNVQQMVRELSAAGMVDFVGSDVHGVRHLPMAFSAWNNDDYKALTNQPTLLNNTLLD